MALPGLKAEAIRFDAQGARAYVLAHGSMREKARLAFILDGALPDREVSRELQRLQNPDGGFPLRQEPGAPSSIESTCAILAELKDLQPLAGSPMASRALAFLRRSQRSDGAWQELPGAATALSANVLYTLLSLEPEQLDPIGRGAAWLWEELAPSASGAGMCGVTLARAGAFWYRFSGPSSAKALYCYRLLQGREPGAAELACWLSSALEMGVGGRLTLAVVGWLFQLAGIQEADGCWHGEAGPSVEVTLEALRVLRGYDMMLGRE